MAQRRLTTNKENYVNKIQRFLAAALVLLCTGLVGVLSVTAPADAKDTSWGRAAASQTVDVSSEKDTSWGKSTARDASFKSGANSALTARRGWICYNTPINCGNLTHLGDDGYNPAFRVRCNYGNNNTIFYIGQFQDARTYGCNDLDEVYVRYGEHYRCRGWSGSYGWYWYGWHDAQGWHKIRDGEQPACVLQAD